jgi:hypothetical protein
MKRTANKAPDERRRLEGAWVLFGLLGAAVAFSGCHEVVVVEPDCSGALAPVGLYSVTGDNEVTLYWIPVAEEYVSEFVIYRSNAPEGTYHEVGHSNRDYFVDRSVVNGHTYFYAISALDHCGYETALSRETIYDTPRPEGFGDRIFDANGDNWRRSAWEFSSYRAVPWDHAGADIYFIWVDNVALLVATDLNTDIQDAGFADFDDVSWAPTKGWSPTGTAEVIPGHVYVVWTRDNHFAKVRARFLDGDSLAFDWAYQIDGGNPELAPRPLRGAPPSSTSPGRGASTG